MNGQEFLDAIHWRYACKKFIQDRKIPAADWSILEEALRWSPSSFGLQPWRFLIVQNPTLRATLTPATWNQTQVVECSHYVVITSLRTMTEDYVDRFIAHTAKTRNVPEESLAGYRSVIVGDVVKGQRSTWVAEWTARQAYIAMGNPMNAAALLRIDACPIEGMEPLEYDRILNLDKTDYRTLAAVALGYRHPDDKYQRLAKVRFDRADVFVDL